MKPLQSQPTRLQWLAAASLNVISDVSGTLATFMPMKSVFILAADDIPDFFPSIFVRGGPIFTGVVLVLVAAVFGILSGWAKKTSSQLAAPSSLFPSVAHSDEQQQARRSVGLPLKRFSSIVLSVILLGGALFVSVPFVAIILLWVIGSAGVIALKVHRGSRKPPFPNGKVEFQAQFKGWLSGASLWSAVGAAILTLVIAVPALGLTGILLGAILLRRVQQVIPDLVPLILAPDRSALESGSQVPTTAKIARSPYDFLATPVGLRLLRRSLALYGGADCEWGLVGRPRLSNLSLYVRESSESGVRILRVFGLKDEERLETELAWRESSEALLPTKAGEIRRLVVADYPSLEISFDPRYSPQPHRLVSLVTAIEWQIRWELEKVSSTAAQSALALFQTPGPEDFFLPHLVAASQLRSIYDKDVKMVLQKADLLSDIHQSSRKVVCLDGPVSSGNLMWRRDGGLELLNASSLRVDVFGGCWGNANSYSRMAQELAPEFLVDAETVWKAQVCSAMRSLSESLVSRNPGHIRQRSRALLSLLSE